MMTHEEKMKRARAMGKLNNLSLNQIAESATTAEINELTDLFAKWKPGVYVEGDRRKQNDVPYRCIQAHDSTPNPEWTPEATPALWCQYHGTSIDTARWFIVESANPYMDGEYMIWENAEAVTGTYRCKQDNTVHNPEELPGAWDLVYMEELIPAEPEGEEPLTEDEPGEDADGGETEPVEPVEPSTDEDIPDWVAWDHVSPLPNTGDKRRHNGQVWVSTVDGNHWEPGIAGHPWELYR